MLKKQLRPHLPVIAGGAMLALCLVAALVMPRAWSETIRENAFDLVLVADEYLRRATDDGGDQGVVVIDIDRRSIEALGSWPWPRETMAELVEAIAAEKPAAIALDILFAEPDSRSAAALARRLGALTGRVDLDALAQELPDGDKRFATALQGAPAVLGFVLDPEQTKTVPSVPIVTRGPLPLQELWRTAGAIGPAPQLAQGVHGMGALSLPGDADGIIRRVPLLVGAANALLPGLALEAVRVKQHAFAYVAEAEPRVLKVGELVLPLPRDGLLRLVPRVPDQRGVPALSAVDIIEGRADAGRVADAGGLNGAVALIGSSAPEVGGLRHVAYDPLRPSVQIQADAIRQVLSGRVPRPLDGAKLIQPLFLIGMGVLAIWAGTALAPLAGAMLVLAAIALSGIAAVGLSVFANRLVDPLTWSAPAILIFGAASVTSFAQTRRREAQVRRRFEQHLAPAVVRRIVEEPGLMKLTGERREVTAFFTDVEGFTAMTHAAEPERLVAVLDEYFEGAAAIIIEHGGMVDKIVGDAIHALFNAPIDLDNHPSRAVACAIVLREWAAGYRHRDAPAAIGFGRTRIGIETGPAIVGDVGIRAKLDYTAHGDAINAAARLEAANKDLGSTICVGPQAASCCDPALLRPLGTIVVRGREGDALSIFEPWPTATSIAWRETYLEAFTAMESKPQRALELFHQLARAHPDDATLLRVIDRLPPSCAQPAKVRQKS
jgi:adenylate cyclase